MEHLPVHQFVHQNSRALIIDVRSPGEYIKGHIPNAVNIPLFEDGERANVGITYKSQGKDNAIKVGLDIVGPKLSIFVNTVNQFTDTKAIKLYCWRGGMRSSSMAWLFETVGYECFLLKGGYKSYRNLMTFLFDEHEIILLGGETGSGKTQVLWELEKAGEQIIDLEALANHKGSAFGAIGEKPQPSSEHFHNLIIQSFLKLDPGKPVFVEDESSHIGKVGIPDNLWKKMKSSPVIRIDVSLNKRVAHLVKSYGNTKGAELKACVSKIERKLGGKHLKQAMQFIDDGNLDGAARIMLTYYDKSYRFLLERKKKNIIATITTNEQSYAQIAREIKKQWEETNVLNH